MTMVGGTPAFMAPEQARGDNPTQASDWYAVGVMLFHALTGGLPFSGNARDMIFAKQREEPPPPSGRSQGIPEDLDELCHALIAREPTKRPSGREVLEWLAVEPEAALTPPTELFVGRARELRRLDESYRAVQRGDARAMLVAGLSGIGKSALVRHYLASLRATGEAVVLEGRCYERESMPFKGFDEIADALSRLLGRMMPERAAALLPRDVHALVRLLPSLGRVPVIARAPGRALPADPVELQRRAQSALRELLARLADERPLVVAIDDLQWTDVDSARLLAELLAPPEAPAMLLIATFRSEDARSGPGLNMLLESMRQARLADQIHLEALPDEQAGELASALLEKPDDHRAATIAVESGGSPFLIEALAQHANQATGSEVAFDDLMTARVAAVSEEARRLLTIVCVHATPLVQRAAGAAAEVEGVARLVDELREHHLVRTDGLHEDDHVAAYHDRIREAVVASLDNDGVRDCHAAIARALESEARADAEALAIHKAAAGQHEQAAGLALRAAEEAFSAMAFERAARLFEWSMELRPVDRAEARRRQRRMGDALSHAGRAVAAADAYRRAAEGAARSESLELERLAAERLLVSGRIDEGLRALMAILEQLEVVVPENKALAVASMAARRVEVKVRRLIARQRSASELDALDLLRIDTCGSIVAGLTWVDALRGANLQALHMALARKAGEPGRLARALTHDIVISAMSGAEAQSQTDAMLREATDLVAELDDPLAAGLLQMNAGAADYMVGRFPSGARQLRQAEETFRRRCVGVVWEVTSTRLYWLLCLYFMGELGELRSRLPGMLRDAQAIDDRFAETVLETRFAHLDWLTQDDPDAALRDVRAAIGRWSHRGFHTEHGFALIGEVESLIYAGRGGEAFRRVMERWPAVLASGVMGVIQLARIETLHLRARAALAAVDAGVGRVRRMVLLRAAQRDAAAIIDEGVSWATPLGHLVLGGAAAAAGHEERAKEELVLAESGFRNADMKLYAAAATRRRGSLRGGSEGDRWRADADDQLRAEGVVAPHRMVAMLAPGLAHHEHGR